MSAWIGNKALTHWILLDEVRSIELREEVDDAFGASFEIAAHMKDGDEIILAHDLTKERGSLLLASYMDKIRNGDK